MSQFSTDYTGRTVDLSMFASLPASPEVPVPLLLANPPQNIAGILKAVQRWVKLFLTRRGTAVADAQEGCTFMTQLLKGQLQSDTDVAGAFNAAVDEIDVYTREQDLVLGLSRPDDEILTAVVLLPGWQLDKDSLKLRIGFTSKAGSSRQITVPVSLTIK